MPAKQKLTPARRLALTVLYRNFKDGARYSNETNEAAGHVYWQSANWLIENGYAVKSGDQVKLTSGGLALASREGVIQ